MCHSLANIEHHHFKFPANRRRAMCTSTSSAPHSLSFGQGIRLQNGDIMQVQLKNFAGPCITPCR